MSRASIAVVTAALTICGASPAFADATAFLGGNTTPDTRMVKGLAIGMGFTIFGVEVEYSVSDEDAAKALPGLKTGMVNALIQTPVPLGRFQPYVTVGAGIYQETLGTHDETSGGVNVGGGLKVKLVGPLRLRGDYRVFKLGSGALYSPTHRFYVGANLGF
jgi:opacity protein-like surface antigen